MLDAYPSGNLTFFSQSQNLVFSAFVNVYFACGIFVDVPVFCKCKSLRMPISSKSFCALEVSLFFPFPRSFISVPKTLSHIFFSICMTSKLCLSFNIDQKGK
ncbi:hypothetical protein ACJW31_09G175000 [Castanea mollissima]